MLRYSLVAMCVQRNERGRPDVAVSVTGSVALVLPATVCITIVRVYVLAWLTVSWLTVSCVCAPWRCCKQISEYWMIAN